MLSSNYSVAYAIDIEKVWHRQNRSFLETQELKYFIIGIVRHFIIWIKEQMYAWNLRMK